MNKTFSFVVAGLGIAIGATAGYSMGIAASRDAAESSAAGSAESATASANPRRRTAGRTAGGGALTTEGKDRRIVRSFEGSHAWDDEPGPVALDPIGDDGEPPGPVEVERLEKAVAELRQEWVELMGEPIAAASTPAERFSGGSLSSAVGQAMEGAEVGGEVEATDCSEHPCIIFGRLEGDEEDMEEIERSPALQQYESDVLTLLLWATSAEDKANAKMPEEGLFALAFYSVEERTGRGDALDRRIRARVMEYWNTDRPGKRG